MKKAIFAYCVVVLILIILFFTGGFSVGITLSERNITDISEPVHAKESLLIVNAVIMILCLALTIFVTSIKANPIKVKWIIPIICLIIMLFAPIIKFERGGGIANQQTVKNESLIATFARHTK